MFEKLRAFLGKKETKRLLPLLLIGVLLLVFAGRLSGGAGAAEESEESPLAAYEDRVCEEIAGLCGAVRGVGECRVTVRLSGELKRSYSGGKIVYEKTPEIVGIGVVCEGGGSAEVRSALTELLCALYGVGSNRVGVEPLG